MKKIPLNRKLFALHSWLGLFIGIFYLLISLSGGTIVFVRELTQWMYGKEMHCTIQPAKKTISYDSLFEIAKLEHPKNINYYTFGKDVEHPENGFFVSGVKPKPKSIFEPTLRYNVSYVNPYTGKVYFRTDSKGKNDIFFWLVDFHDSFTLGKAGEFTVTLVSIAFLLSLITGFIFYRKSIIKVFLFRVKIKFKNWRTISSDLHRVIGTWALIFNIAIFFSGLYLYKDFFITKWRKGNTIFENTHAKSTKPVLPPKTTSFDTLFKTAKQMQPSAKFGSISISCDNPKTISVFGISNEKLFWNQENYVSVNFNFDGSLRNIDAKKWKDYTFSEKFENINFNVLHTGWALGIVGKVIWTIMGFIPAFLSITGFLLWLRRAKKKQNIKIQDI